MQVNPGWKITRPNWIIENINVTAHLKAGSYVSVEKVRLALTPFLQSICDVVSVREPCIRCAALRV